MLKIILYLIQEPFLLQLSSFQHLLNIVQLLKASKHGKVYLFQQLQAKRLFLLILPIHLQIFWGLLNCAWWDHEGMLLWRIWSCLPNMYELIENEHQLSKPHINSSFRLGKFQRCVVLIRRFLQSRDQLRMVALKPFVFLLVILNKIKITDNNFAQKSV